MAFMLAISRLLPWAGIIEPFAVSICFLTIHMSITRNERLFDDDVTVHAYIALFQNVLFDVIVLFFVHHCFGTLHK